MLLEPLLGWLAARRWIREDSVVIEELAINGRRVDVSTLTRSGTLSAFELKLGSFGRALEQAFYNARLYDRSWIVLDAMPRVRNVEEAVQCGVGVLVRSGPSFVVVCQPGPRASDLVPRRRVTEKIREQVRRHG
jgi:hypothetical protein